MVNASIAALDETRSLSACSETELVLMLEELAALSRHVEVRRAAIAEAMMKKENEQKPLSFAEAKYGDSLPGIGIPDAVCDWLGPRGLGIRSVSSQLTSYTREFLTDQLRDLSRRRAARSGGSDLLNDDDIGRMLDTVERALASNGFTLKR